VPGAVPNGYARSANALADDSPYIDTGTNRLNFQIGTYKNITAVDYITNEPWLPNNAGVLLALATMPHEAYVQAPATGSDASAPGVNPSGEAPGSNPGDAGGRASGPSNGAGAAPSGSGGCTVVGDRNPRIALLGFVAASLVALRLRRRRQRPS
jgi:hypothetical protein